jgi:hypothetical protein
MMPDVYRWQANTKWNFIYVENGLEQVRVMTARRYHRGDILNPY